MAKDMYSYQLTIILISVCSPDLEISSMYTFFQIILQ